MHRVHRIKLKQGRIQGGAKGHVPPPRNLKEEKKKGRKREKDKEKSSPFHIKIFLGFF